MQSGSHQPDSSPPDDAGSKPCRKSASPIAATAMATIVGTGQRGARLGEGGGEDEGEG